MDRSPFGSGRSPRSISPERYPFFNAEEFPAANHPTRLSEERVAKFPKEFEIPTGAWHTYLPGAADRIWHNPPVPKGYGNVATGISEAALKCGFRVPMLPLVKQLFAQMGIALGQMDPNGFLHMNGFQCRCLVANVDPTPALFWHHHDFRKNGKSKGFYSIARRTNRAEWVETNSNNKGSHDKWCYISGPKIAVISQWRVVDPSVQVVKPTLSGAELHEYNRLCNFDMGRIPLDDLRDRQWLFALWDNVSSRQAIVERKMAKFEAEQAALAAKAAEAAEATGAGAASSDGRQEGDKRTPEQSSPTSPPPTDQAEQATGSAQVRKRARRGDVLKTYVPQWAILESDAIATADSKAIKEIAPDLCWALVLPADCPTYDQLGIADACADLMAFLSKATPMAAIIIDKVKDMQGSFGQIQELEVQAVRSETALRQAVGDVERLEGQSAALRADREALQKELDSLRARLTQRNLSLKASRKMARKETKLRLNAEERCYQMGHDEVVRRAAAMGLEHQALIEPDFSDPVGRPDDDEPPVVSSGEDEDLSD
ncbi:hypothetical protein POM88_009287 [Heracleum sosnowskyi]|uniref:Uncharacterized protein n=1 Tax=Heracleum sosnowskyi TaxID=360622 RepID=A0AAD8N7C1_9APIA|nr:hypothetical protein POM88_009287 [Heracleum sosnowskyi]